MILVGDIGGTNTRLALFEQGKEVGEEKKFISRNYKGLEEIVLSYLQGRRVEKACFGIAGPVRNGVCKATNLPWIVDAAQLGKVAHIPAVYLLNDLESNAYGLLVLRKEEFCVLNQGVVQAGNQALIAAGTGLGEAGLYWDGQVHRPFACEGGHTDFAPRDEMEIELLNYLRAKISHVSYERVISGPGLYAIFQFLIDSKKYTLHSVVKEEIEHSDPAKVISKWGAEKKDPACQHALDWFVSLYGAEAGNLALKMLALGGLYIGGGIVTQIVKKMQEGSFMSSFVNKGRFQQLLASIPIKIILNDRAALLGALAYAEGQ